MSVEIFEASPLVSVLIRSMDRASLSDALTSVAAQTYPSIEVVLVNAKGDGHSDVGQWCGRFPIRFVGTAGGLGRSAAANLGLEQAHGTYLMFLDDDDLIDAEHIASLASILAESPHFKAAFSGTRVVDATGATLGVYDQDFSGAQLLIGNLLPIHSVLFSRELVMAGCRFDVTLETYEDWDFWLQVSQLTDFAKTGKVTAAYRSFLGDSGMAHPEHRPLQRQRRSVVWRKWWPFWSVDNLDRLALDLEQKQEEKERENAELRSAVGLQFDKNEQLQHDVAALQQSLDEQVQQVSSLGLKVAVLDVSLAERDRELTLRDMQIRTLNASIQEMLSSTSWRLSAPIRHVGHWMGVLRRKVSAVKLLARLTWQFLRRDSIGNQVGDAYRFVRQKGWPGIKQRLARRAASTPSTLSPLSFNSLVATNGLQPSEAVRVERNDYLPLASIDVDKYAYFFFDVFDTAVIRLLEKPVDIFKYIGCMAGANDFENQRVNQERKAREVNRSHKDIKLTEIYRGFKGADLKREIDAELKFCIAHPETLAFYSDLVAKGKKIYFVSDMYLDRETIGKILSKNGFNIYEEIFVSSEDDLIKGDGSRFAWLKNTVPDSVGTTIHIGDNHVSDWVQPRQHGYDAFHFLESIEFYRHDSFLFSKAPYLIEENSLGISFILGMFKYWKSGFLQEKPGYWKQFGFFYGGALVCAFCEFVNRTILNANLSTSRVFFLARDGDIMSQVYRLLHSEYEPVYLLASRRCMSLPALSTFSPADDGDALKLFTTPVGVAGVNDLMERFGYEDLHDLRDALIDLESRGLLHSELEIQQCVIDNKDSILSKADAERHTLLRYLDVMHFFEDTDIVIADVGWGGSIQNALMKLLKQSGKGPRNLHGIYLGVGDQVAHEEFKTGFLFQGDRSRFAEFLNLIELLTSSPRDGVVRVEEVDGAYVSVTGRKNADESKRQIIAAEIQAGILEFAQIVRDRKIGDLSFLKPRDFEALFGALQVHPSEEDVEQLGGVKHAMTLGSHFGDHVLNKKG